MAGAFLPAQRPGRRREEHGVPRASGDMHEPKASLNLRKVALVARAPADATVRSSLLTSTETCTNATPASSAGRLIGRVRSCRPPRHGRRDGGAQRVGASGDLHEPNAGLKLRKVALAVCVTAVSSGTAVAAEERRAIGQQRPARTQRQPQAPEGCIADLCLRRRRLHMTCPLRSLRLRRACACARSACASGIVVHRILDLLREVVASHDVAPHRLRIAR